MSRLRISGEDLLQRVVRARRSAVVTASPAISALSGSLFIAAGMVVEFSTLVSSGTPNRDLVLVRIVNLLAIAGGVLVLAARNRHLRLLPQVVTASGVLLITAAMWGSGGGVGAVAYASVYCLVPGYAFLILTRRSAAIHMAVLVVIGVPSLALQPGVGVAEQVVVWGVAVLLAGVIGWMARLLEQAEADSLTGLANRRGVERALQEAIVSTGDSGHLSFAVLDVDHFKAFNDDRGRQMGDELLAALAAAWSPLVPAGATLGRLSADEFGIVLPGLAAGQATALVSQLHRAVPEGATCSAGVATRERAESASMLVARTDSAVYTAKREGRARTHEHPGGGRDDGGVREAVARGEFVVHFQPIVELATGSTVSAEALVRWQHPTRGLVGPMEFLPAAERSGAVVELGRWMLDEACRQAAAWRPVDGVLPYVTVNASGRELQDPTYASTVRAALDASGLPARRLVLELVESSYDIESVHLVNNLHRIRAMGVRTAMDDFGVGYSSLSRLRRAGVDILKIDRSFTADITDGGQGAPLVSAIIAMARALDLKVVAEGVETPAQARWLTMSGCDCAQGWLFGRPAPTLPQSPSPSRMLAEGTPSSL